MKCNLHLVFPLLLITSVVSFSSSGPHHNSDGQQQTAFEVQGLSKEFFRDWELPPNPNSTHHLIFNSVSGFLQRWPNLLRRYGHSIVPATIPIGTILYHGRGDNRVPDVSEWFAFDIEFSFLFGLGPSYVITLQAKQDLRVLYFDGAAAVKMKGGTMDSQDIVAWGRIRPDKYFAERDRIKALCDWGKQFGLDGFVRMGFNFEVMICDVLDGLEVVTLLNLLPRNVTEPDNQPPPPDGPLPPIYQPPLVVELPAGWRGSLQSYAITRFEAYLTGGWHDFAPGETRVQLDYTGLVTFYDPTLSSLVEARQGKDRLHHRLEGISAADAAHVRAELRSVLTRKKASSGSGSSVDWGSIARVVVERYADRLEHLRFLLSPNATFTDAAEQAFVVRTRLLVMLGPYITTVDVPPACGSANGSWLAPVVHRCATTQTSHIPLGMLTPQEVRIHAAVESTLREICRRLALVWVEFFDVEGADEVKAAEVIGVGHRHIDELMNWLDWSLWVRCEPACRLGESCHIPSWRLDDEYDMTPRCISPNDEVHL